LKSGQRNTVSPEEPTCGAAGEMSDISSGTPWSEQNIRDLRDAVQRGETAEAIATFLCRDVDEVLAKIAELEL
jgi:hypothetical protein